MPQLVILLIIGILAQSEVIAMASCLLLMLRLLKANRVFPFLQNRTLDLGILFLLLSILSPLAAGKVGKTELIYCLTSKAGIIAIIGGLLATWLNGRGINLMQEQPEIILGLILGSLLGIVFFQGVPVGPLTAAGLTAACLLFRRKV